SQLRQQKVEIARAIVAASGLHYDSYLNQIRSRQYPALVRKPGCARSAPLPVPGPKLRRAQMCQ
ncbi:MAG: hypothetical protein WA728_24300, partial [Xanthobacteraceae bacterium]